MAEGGAEETLSRALKQKEALEESEKESKERLELRQKQMESISKVGNEIDDILAFARKTIEKKGAASGDKWST